MRGASPESSIGTSSARRQSCSTPRAFTHEHPPSLHERSRAGVCAMNEIDGTKPGLSASVPAPGLSGAAPAGLLRAAAGQYSEQLVSAVSLIVLVAVLGALSPAFLSVGNFLDIARVVSIIGIMAMGMTLVVLIGGIDL